MIGQFRQPVSGKNFLRPGNVHSADGWREVLELIDTGGIIDFRQADESIKSFFRLWIRIFRVLNP